MTNVTVLWMLNLGPVCFWRLKTLHSRCRASSSFWVIVSRTFGVRRKVYAHELVAPLLGLNSNGKNATLEGCLCLIQHNAGKGRGDCLLSFRLYGIHVCILCVCDIRLTGASCSNDHTPSNALLTTNAMGIAGACCSDLLLYALCCDLRKFYC
jgi:hypothetical protein